MLVQELSEWSPADLVVNDLLAVPAFILPGLNAGLPPPRSLAASRRQSGVDEQVAETEVGRLRGQLDQARIRMEVRVQD